MNSEPIPKPSDEELARLIAEHGPSRPPAYATLRPLAELVAALRAKGASAETIRHILRARGVLVSETTLRNFLRDVVGEAPAPPTPRPRRRLRPALPAEPTPHPPPKIPEPVPPPRTRGPRIANLQRNPDA